MTTKVITTIAFTAMQRNSAGSNWIVKKLIERDHINNHYRRLNGAQSRLQWGRSERLSKSSPDINFEIRQQKLEKRVARDFSLDTSPTGTDDKSDVMRRHSDYFTHPVKSFTPRIVQKIVRPSQPPQSAKTWRSSTAALSRSSSKMASRSTPRANTVQHSSRQDAYINKHVDDAAYETSTEKSDHSTDFPAGDFKKWIRQQEEEHNYLQLMCDVTSEVLLRKLCTHGEMKEVIIKQIKKSNGPFSIHPSQLMRKLCDDLKIPAASSANNQYYGYNTAKKSFSGGEISINGDQKMEEICGEGIERSVPPVEEYSFGERPEENRQEVAGIEVDELYVNDTFDSDTVDEIDEEHVDSDW